ncbi:MAG: YwiC-like family protein [Acidimicrobiia bacterium]
MTEAETRPRAAWRAVAIPDEHGGWALTAEPALLGILVAPSWAGAALVIAAFVAFLVRTPLKLVLVDRWRGRWLPRSRLALLVAIGELAALTGLALAVIAAAGWTWLLPVAVAVPLVGVELWFDMRSRSRRLVPELSGAVGIAAVAASVALAGGAGGRLAIALWVVLAARSIAAIPFVRVQIDRLRHGSGAVRVSDRAQLVGGVVAVGAVIVDPAVTAGALAVAALLVVQLIWVRRPPVPAKVLGLRQLAMGLVVVAATAAGVLI